MSENDQKIIDSFERAPNKTWSFVALSARARDEGNSLRIIFGDARDTNNHLAYASLPTFLRRYLLQEGIAWQKWGRNILFCFCASAPLTVSGLLSGNFNTAAVAGAAGVLSIGCISVFVKAMNSLKNQAWAHIK
jgi:hypothetical protein